MLKNWKAKPDSFDVSLVKDIGSWRYRYVILNWLHFELVLLIWQQSESTHPVEGARGHLPLSQLYVSSLTARYRKASHCLDLFQCGGNIESGNRARLLGPWQEGWTGFNNIHSQYCWSQSIISVVCLQCSSHRMETIGFRRTPCCADCKPTLCPLLEPTPTPVRTYPC